MPTKKGKPAKVVIHIYRHGERPTDSILGGNLTDRGKRQGAKIGTTLAREMGANKTPKLVIFYASPVGRNVDFMQRISASMMEKAIQVGFPVREISAHIHKKFKYGSIFNTKKFNILYGKMPLDEFNRLWIQGKTDPSVVEQPADVLERIRTHTEKYAAKLSEKYRGKPVEIHVAIVTHGDLMGVLRQRITGKQSMYGGRRKTNFGEQIKLTVRGKKGFFETRGVRKRTTLRSARR